MNSILVVDDIPENIEILYEILSSQYQIKAAINGQMALKIAMEKNSPDLILLDIMMPEMDGYEVCRKLKSEEKTKDIPVIFITAKNEIKDESEGLKVGAIDYITKPVNPDIVKARIKNHLELKISRQKLKGQNKQLKSILKLKEDMVNMIVHDMRTPLSTILSYNELLTIKKAVLPKYLKYTDKIQTAANYLNSFFNDMLILAKTEEEQLQLNYSWIDIKSLISAVEEMHSGTTQLKKISLKIELPEKEKSKVFLDVKLFQRVLDNLLTNALKFSPPQTTITIQVFFLSPKTSSKHTLGIKVIDEGQGISVEDQKNVFDKFAVAQLRSKGTSQVGLGLTFCKVVVEAHGGKIFVANNTPKGSIFTIEVPIEMQQDSKQNECLH